MAPTSDLPYEVERAVADRFGTANPDAAVQALEAFRGHFLRQFGDTSDVVLDRICHAVIQLSNGKIEHLRAVVKEALADYGRVLAEAERL
ncbi:MAG: hypothetical protein ACYTGX_16270 [Planctomycetota bacterium]